MTLWIIFGIMTILAALFALWPLTRRVAVAVEATDLDVYRQQLDELAHERALGRLGEAEAEAARIELSRRLLHASEREGGSLHSHGQLSRRIGAILACIVIPLVGFVFYGLNGAPTLPPQPLAARLDNADRDRDLPAMVAKIEAHLREKPDDVKGWEVVAPILARMGRIDDAINAYRTIIRLSGSDAERESALGELYITRDDGEVGQEALAAFERALAHTPKDPKALFFKGLHFAQNGNKAEARALWQGVLADSAPDAPWVPFIKMQLAQLDAPAAGPQSEAGRAIQQMPAADQQAMIRQMVEGLATRLRQDGADVNGWLRLIRAYAVLGEAGKAKEALDDAKKALSGNKDALDQLQSLGKELKISQE